jgi:serine O-acetyltransferase
LNIKELYNQIFYDLLRYEHTYKLRNDYKKFWKICLESLLFKSGFQATLLYRIAHFLYKNNLNYSAWFITRINQFLTSAEIEYNFEAGEGLLITHPAGIVIGRGSKVGNNCIIYQNVTLGAKDLHNIEYPKIGDNVIIFSGSKILGGIVIENNCIIGANAIVTKSINSENITVVGVNKIL